ncbi:MAG: MotA/TolQ/ExbB proton channel family protein [Candidatus Omnitrophota bacterium]
MSIWEFSLKDIIVQGGPIMIPLLICSVFALAIVISKLIFFSRISTDTHKLRKDIFALIKKNKIKDAIRLCDSNPSPVAKILKGGLLKFGCSRDEIKEAMEDVSLFEIPILEKRFTALATIAHISPLLGLLGTVTGMTSSFYTIQQRAASLNPVTPGDLAGGIGEALLTTVAGLVIAIPTYFAYNYLVSRVNATVNEMEHAATELVNFMSHLAEVPDNSILNPD